MDELDFERAALAKADRDIADGERRVAEQEALLERLRAHDESTDVAESLLATLGETLGAWRDHRREIVRRIDHLVATGGGSAL